MTERTSIRRAWLPIAACVGIGANGLRLRARVRALPVIGPAGRPVHPSHRFLLAEGVHLDEAQRRAASAYARREGLTVLDLVPSTMAAHELLDLARMVDPEPYRAQRLAPGRGAYHALLVDQEVLDRSGLALVRPDRAELAAATATLKLHAPAATGLAILPGLAAAPAQGTAPVQGGKAQGSTTQGSAQSGEAAPRNGRDRIAVQFAALPWEPALPFLPLVRDLAVGAGATAAPAWALGAAVLSWLQPAVVGAGRIRVPATELLRSPLTRRQPMASFLASPLTAASAPRPGPPATDPAALAAKRHQYRADLAAGVDRFLEAPSAACPWCGGTDLSLALAGSDSVQAKPGVFRYDRCGDCGHVFQNPRLTLDGLEFYYRDVYSGLGAALIEELFRRNTDIYLTRARLDIPAPRRWLDVGGGFGHFCAAAREVWPTTSFDGLDIGESINLAGRRGWVDHVHQGRLPDLAGELSGRYDVVSMFHYLEHTRDPREELHAAARTLAPGGHLIIEVPNPQCPAGRWFGAYWPGWFVPQHQHLIPADNLVHALDEAGLKVLDVCFGEAHQGGDAPIALWGAWQRAAPSPAMPWQEVASPARARARRVLTGAAMGAAMPAAVAWDAASRRYMTGGRRSNAYRVLACLR
ncbi:methyltransferase type 12 [Parafrankia colletiae]|uniref:Methyltransferase type 12 n=1 Tax=Parafrankia colletiae TaxID=573497 RepID=A0A1S1QTF6_9ACTN|nr:class I SAM-dependent methyltransferase [Parafrankia colletiae]MCK9903531.1 class I SAM-dependent methyltransferase [Frankia sp. Cpl3]OHV36876.1 methyltransferase type 12 [Parafrankia colletiae]